MLSFSVLDNVSTQLKYAFLIVSIGDFENVVSINCSIQNIFSSWDISLDFKLCKMLSDSDDSIYEIKLSIAKTLNKKFAADHRYEWIGLTMWRARQSNI